MNLIYQIKDSGIVAVIRGANKDNIIPIAKALSKGGVTALELTVETPKILSLVEMVADELKEEAIVGVGTVLDPETARAAIMSGAKFVFSPVVNVETIKMTKRYGVLSVPGALTPTEILTAYEHGADIIKVFPANVVGPGYFKDVRGPLPHIPMMPTGGIDVSNVGAYIKAGAIAAGVGSTLVNTKAVIDEAYCTELTERARKFVNEVKLARGTN
ncbi:bifunctional 4-hydroxy-2-oxoglutarate aldolase/2-dehydro-3-deoxy-phosphogluconate aldolase [Anaerobacillus sp. CMMVII]|uniref:bifunctional 4-hydroxy-2-oxoglutarate aldolase/2-dehydro-3-deoxy-phosphogluconate aldolase n=1 Tax=Anaerobacillus sp. CMMVII TaxID=2755588 RepID=UPI0021B82F29|nr:bifunctional 4-hydroxy-2-oxoglutarate aldolase/2-dehydro-3-deoxy-phosphogluconate aldolase [Anaerobacillus sp. CMMVII]MCT8137117.1 bifunctional 4-hydroxy-2-oxoglutarate aldolase/2-dehydro-3-deoxy-phosphogluconate aldolase [Anaerobacillus sp. CMMVII]